MLRDVHARSFCSAPSHTRTAPCLAQPSRHLVARQRRSCRVASLPGDIPDDTSSNGQASSGWGSAPRRSSSDNSGQQQQQQQQQQPSTWGSSWAGRRSSSSSSSSKTHKPVSSFNRPSPTGSDSTSGDNRTVALDPGLEASIRQNVDRAAQTLQEIVTEVLNELLIDEASAYVLDEANPGLQLNQAARNAVVKRLEWLDANFLAALNAYLAAPGVAANHELRALLGAIRQEVLDLVSARLPSSVQVLNAALGHSGRSGRSKVVSDALAGGGGALPGASLDALGAAASQLVEDMEDQQVVADRVLLARLVLLREELRLRAEQQVARTQFFGNIGHDAFTANEQINPSNSQDNSGSGASNKFFAFHRSNLPARCAAFMKELLGVPERDRRLGIITKAFQEDWVGESPSTGPSQPSTNTRPSRDNNFAHQTRPESLDIVRPGRFFTTLLAMRAELEQRLVSSDLGDVGSGEATLAVLQQMEAIRLEALVALDRIQHNRPTTTSSDVCYDYELDLNV